MSNRSERRKAARLKVVVIQPGPEGPCTYCGRWKELRPYGRNGVQICFDCGQKPENFAETERRLNKRFEEGDGPEMYPEANN